MSNKLKHEDVFNMIIQKCYEKNIAFMNGNEWIYKGAAFLDIHLKCNIDGYEWKTSKNRFIDSNRGCGVCGHSVKHTTQQIKPLIINKCKEKNYTFLNLKDWKYNTCKTVNIHLKCNIDGYEWKTSKNKFIDKDSGCGFCSGNIKYKTEDIKPLIINKCKEKNYTFLNEDSWVSDGTCTNNIKLICNIDGHKWISNISKFINKDSGCKKCANKLSYTTEEIKPLIINKCKEKNYTFLNLKDWKYIKNNNLNIKIKCDKCNYEWKSSYVRLILQNVGCPKCNNSRGEQQIEKYLKENNIDYEYQKKFKKCINKKELPFDFYLLEHNVCIEYDGEQHFKPNYHFGGEKEFNKTKKRDKIKTDYCEENNIKLLRIPYTEFNNIENILKENNII